jgi:hypothetical protein|tara:strand:+ start:1183 stop:1293 length:111 start_codon:yes stop_codon:yes gene_type:complete
MEALLELKFFNIIKFPEARQLRHGKQGIQKLKDTEI